VAVADHPDLGREAAVAGDVEVAADEDLRARRGAADAGDGVVVARTPDRIARPRAAEAGAAGWAGAAARPGAAGRAGAAGWAGAAGRAGAAGLTGCPGVARRARRT